MTAKSASPPRRTARAVRAAALVAAAALAVAAGVSAAPAQPRHALAMHGDPALPPDFTHFRYADPAAPKGGRLVQGSIGTFDSLNPFVVKGIAPQAIRGYVVESLMTRGYDEPFTLYGLLAESVETDPARTFVTFALNPAARFSDGRPVTAEDVVFSWRLLRDHGRPNYRLYYGKVRHAQALDGRTVRFDFADSGDRELPLILGLMPILPRHAIDVARFEETSFAPPVGSGPYRVTDVRPGESVTLARDPGYWGRDLSVNRGLWNFDEVRFDFYRDVNANLEAFKKGLFDIRPEDDAGRWETAYDFPAVRDGRVVKDGFTDGLPKGMLAYVFNTRRPVFADIRVREAIALLFDFEWVNHNLFYDRYRRVGSYFEGSELSSRGRQEDARERALLAPFPRAVRKDIAEGSWQPAVSDGSGRDRKTLRRALALFAAAGYELQGTQLVSRESGQPLAFEIMVTTRDDERLALLFARFLQRAGVTAQVRNVDAVQYDRRRLSYDFDMIQNRWDESLSPGNEQAFYWGSAAADQDGTRNYMGVKSAAADAIIAAMLKAEDRADFVSATRALDRVLLSGFYVVPLFYRPEQWVARWTRIARPRATSLSGYLLESWWHAP